MTGLLIVGALCGVSGVAAAFGVQLTHDSEVESRLRHYFGGHLTAAHLKLAEIPQLSDGPSYHRFPLPSALLHMTRNF